MPKPREVDYAAVLKRLGATVILECPERLLKILARTPGIDQVVPQGQDFPDYDVYDPLLTVPGLVGTSMGTIPAGVPYVLPDPDRFERWRRELSEAREFKVGIHWQCNPKYGGDYHHSIPPVHFERLSRVPGGRLYSLQKNDVIEQPAGSPGSSP